VACADPGWWCEGGGFRGGSSATTRALGPPGKARDLARDSERLLCRGARGGGHRGQMEGCSAHRSRGEAGRGRRRRGVAEWGGRGRVRALSRAGARECAARSAVPAGDPGPGIRATGPGLGAGVAVASVPAAPLPPPAHCPRPARSPLPPSRLLPRLPPSAACALRSRRTRSPAGTRRRRRDSPGSECGS
jgi:hypothetical protein